MAFSLDQDVDIAGQKIPMWAILSGAVIMGALVWWLTTRAGSSTAPVMAPVDANSNAGQGLLGPGGSTLDSLSAQEKAAAAANLAAIQGLQGALDHLANSLTGKLPAAGGGSGGATVVPNQPGNNGLGNNPIPAQVSAGARSDFPVSAPQAGGGYQYAGFDVANNALLLRNLLTGVVESFNPASPPPYSVAKGASATSTPIPAGAGFNGPDLGNQGQAA